MKKGFSDLRISGKLFLAPMVGIIFLILLALSAYIGLTYQRSSVIEIYKQFKGFENSARIINDVTNVHANVYRIVSLAAARTDQKELSDLSDEQTAVLAGDIELLDEILKTVALNEKETKLYRGAKEQLEDYRKAAAAVMGEASAGNSGSAISMTEAAAKFQVLNNNLLELLELENKLSRESYAASMKKFDTTIIIFAVIVIAAIVLSVFTGVFILRKMVAAPIKAIATAAQNISEGDLTFDVRAGGDDEIGRMIQLLKESFGTLGNILRSIRDLSSRISDVVRDVGAQSRGVVAGAEVEAEAIISISESVGGLNSATIEIAGNTENLAVSAEGTSASIEEMAVNIKSINNNMHDLSGAVESIASSVEELSATISEVASHAGALDSASKETLISISEITTAITEVKESARESALQSRKVSSEASTLGMTSIEKNIEGMKNIKAAVEQTADFITTLSGRSEEIGNILTVIEEVTDKTGLLSLNAAILAAQAGEHGKGFAIVADEIKELAYETTISTGEIAALIKAVQQDIENVSDAMHRGIGFVEAGFILTGETKKALTAILRSSEKSTEMARSIEDATAIQVKSAGLVSEAMQRVRDMSDHIARTTAEQSKGAVLITNDTEKMRDASHLVSTATAEQAKTSAYIAQAVGNISELSRQISVALSEHKRNSAKILETIEQMKNIPVENMKMASSISSSLEGIMNDAEHLRAETQRFKLGDERALKKNSTG
ncbi:MAG: hypothetical protein C0402_06835 [Thermodesulfovibrio sp.]|nr:hypothetical protein [Thermodesulfovibrio sp.]